MNEQIVALKHYVLELEYSLSVDDADGIRNATRKIKDITNQVEADYKTVKGTTTGVYFKAINTIPFLYKPIHVHNPYEGEFLERFSQERTDQLTHAGAISAHNKFWTEHNVVKGNVFGSVPKELISEDAVFALKRMGWLEVKVDVLDFGRRVTDLRALSEFCHANFGHFIMVHEQPTEATIALKFAV